MFPFGLETSLKHSQLVGTTESKIFLQIICAEKIVRVDFGMDNPK